MWFDINGTNTYRRDEYVMATYDYECPSDGAVITVMRGMTEDERDYYCTVCDSKLQRIYNPAPVKFKGAGFYSTGG